MDRPDGETALDIRPIGFVRSALTSGADAPRQGDELILLTWLHLTDRAVPRAQAIDNRLLPGQLLPAPKGACMDPLTLSPHQSVTIVERSTDVLEVETTYAPGGGAPPQHYHPAQDEHFEVEEGAIYIRIGDDRRTIHAGETIDIPRGTAHSMWTASDTPARVRWQTRPAGRTEQWFRSIDALYRRGQVPAASNPNPLAFAVLLADYRDTFRLAIAPDWILRPLVWMLALIGRTRGFRASPPGA